MSAEEKLDEVGHFHADKYCQTCNIVWIMVADNKKTVTWLQNFPEKHAKLIRIH